jgi:hypothetical protein
LRASWPTVARLDHPNPQTFSLIGKIKRERSSVQAQVAQNLSAAVAVQTLTDDKSCALRWMIDRTTQGSSFKKLSDKRINKFLSSLQSSLSLSLLLLLSLLGLTTDVW